MAWPLSDAFTGSDETTLDTYDAKWIQSVASSAGNLKLYSNRVTASADGLSQIYYYNEAPPSADYEVSALCVIGIVSGTYGHFPSVLGRVKANPDSDFYMARPAQQSAGGNGYQLYKRISGSFYQLGSTSSATFSQYTGYPVYLRMAGTAISLHTGNANSPLVSASDSDIGAAGFPGIRIFSTGNSTAPGRAAVDEFAATALTISASNPLIRYSRRFQHMMVR